MINECNLRIKSLKKKQNCRLSVDGDFMEFNESIFKALKLHPWNMRMYRKLIKNHLDWKILNFIKSSPWMLFLENCHSPLLRHSSPIYHRFN